MDSSFRIEDGVLLVERLVEFKVHTLRLEYRGNDRTQRPYPGLQAFLEVRESRERHIGSGLCPPT